MITRACLTAGVLASVMPCAANALTCLKWSNYVVEGGKVLYIASGRQERAKSIILRSLDAKTFRRLADPGPIGSCAAGYAVDASHAVYEGKLISGADVASMQVMGGAWSAYARDRHRVYVEGKPIAVDPGKFRVEANGYATDGSAGFWLAKRLPGKAFTALQQYAKSDAAVFYEGNALAGFDPTAFREFSERPSYGRDARNVAYEGRRIEGADAATFEIVPPAVLDHARDRSRVYYRGKPIPHADPASLLPILYGYFRDRRAVYKEGTEIVGADPVTFRVTGLGRYAVDATKVYRDGVPMPGRDAPTFEELKGSYTKDKNAVYYQDARVPEADPATFVMTRLNIGNDRRYRYFGHTLICKHDPAAPGALPAC